MTKATWAYWHVSRYEQLESVIKRYPPSGGREETILWELLEFVKNKRLTSLKILPCNQHYSPDFSTQYYGGKY